MRLKPMLGLLILLSACQTTASVATRVPAQDVCAAFKPIRWAHDDSRETQIQVVAHNAAWKSLCGGGA